MARRKQTAGPGKPTQVQQADMDFPALVAAIREVHEQCAAQAKRAVNVALTMRNWLVGSYIREYEQNGADRAAYGEGLLDRLSERLISGGFSELTARYLRLCRQFASVYPQIWQSLTAKSEHVLLPPAIWRSLTAKSSDPGEEDPIQKSAISELRPPVGLLLCTGKDHAFVEYALAAMDNRLFVSKYQLELPSTEDLQKFIEEKRQALGGEP